MAAAEQQLAKITSAEHVANMGLDDLTARQKLEALTTEIDRVVADKKSIEIDATTEEIDAAVAALVEKLTTLTSAEYVASLGLDDLDAQTKIGTLQQAIVEVTLGDNTVTIDAQDNATPVVDGLAGSIGEVTGKRHAVPIDAEDNVTPIVEGQVKPAIASVEGVHTATLNADGNAKQEATETAAAVQEVNTTATANLQATGDGGQKAKDAKTDVTEFGQTKATATIDTNDLGSFKIRSARDALNEINGNTYTANVQVTGEGAAVGAAKAVRRELDRVVAASPVTASISVAGAGAATSEIAAVTSAAREAENSDPVVTISTNAAAITGELKSVATSADEAAKKRDLTFSSNAGAITGDANTLVAAADKAAQARTLTISSNVPAVTGEANSLSTAADAATKARALNVTSNLGAVTGEANTLNSAADTAVKPRALNISTNAAAATAQVNAFSSAADNAARTRTAIINVRADVGGAESAISNAARNRTATITVTEKVVTAAANGAIMSFNNGGISEKHVAQIAPAGAWRVWAEPETGGEAYIPLADSKRPRSLSILEEVARRFGRAVVPLEDGGLINPRPSATQLPGTMVHHSITIAEGAVRIEGTPQAETADMIERSLRRLADDVKLEMNSR